MRLTPDHVLQAEQKLNCLGDRELLLRGMGIPVIENLAVAKDGFDVIDLSSNIITELGDGFPPFPRLTTLYLGSNRISCIKTGVADSLPNLEVLILTSNRLGSVQDLNVKELSRFKQLEVLSILDNPIIDHPGIREMLIEHIPTLKVINFRKISLFERKEAERKNGFLRGKKRKKTAGENRKVAKSRSKTFDVGSLGEDFNKRQKLNSATSNPVSLTSEQSEALKLLIEKADTVEQVTRIQNAIRNGRVADVLGTDNASERLNKVS